MTDTVYLDKEKGERVCHECGLVVDRPMHFSEDLPFDTTYALTRNQHSLQEKLKAENR